ncbi:GLIPR1-like protein 1 [Acomys russatus]|uniref:GLIPR1-like protein 1 n=1 Tax=Acomys russatus TaxID=60746 RepID=UPI0021E3153C|nr:GLIPR1-like protein 1 [Acomys russatus]
MALKKKLSCLWILTLCLAACRLSKAADEIPKVPSINNPKFIREFVDHHNELRGKVNPTAADMNSLSWDKALAEVARTWAKRCLFSHNPCTGKRYGCISGYDYLGENIYLGGINTVPRQVVYAWYNESKDYDFDNKTCSKTCGHYTQVVWAKSLKVGCAVANCPHLLGNSAGLFVCNYSPAGNYKDVNPYTKGKPCSMCGKDDCMDNLCRLHSCWELMTAIAVFYPKTDIAHRSIF